MPSDAALDRWGLTHDGHEYGPFDTKQAALVYGGTLAAAEIGPMHEWNAFPLIDPSTTPAVPPIEPEGKPMSTDPRPEIYNEVRAERDRAHTKHGDTSMERLPVTDMTRLSVLLEEVGEVAREFNEARHRVHKGLLPQQEREQSIDLPALRAELIQVAAMATAWADAIPGGA